MQTVAEACRTGASTNIIFGLALGYQSCIVPSIVLAIIIYISFSLANMYGVACAAIGMLGTLATGASTHPTLLAQTFLISASHATLSAYVFAVCNWTAMHGAGATLAHMLLPRRTRMIMKHSVMGA